MSVNRLTLPLYLGGSHRSSIFVISRPVAALL